MIVEDFDCTKELHFGEVGRRASMIAIGIIPDLQKIHSVGDFLFLESNSD